MSTKLKGSGGHIVADITDEQRKKADLGVGELFLAPIGRIEQNKITNYYCKNCDAEFSEAPKLDFENPNEQVAEGMILQEIGKYLCTKCDSKIGEYRTFLKS
jgi:DNA-directed RNA polymerase subunit RPC12/RpoP